MSTAWSTWCPPGCGPRWYHDPALPAALFASFFATEVIVTKFFGLSSGTYHHYFRLYLPPIDIFYSFVQGDDLRGRGHHRALLLRLHGQRAGRPGWGWRSVGPSASPSSWWWWSTSSCPWCSSAASTSRRGWSDEAPGPRPGQPARPRRAGDDDGDADPRLERRLLRATTPSAGSSPRQARASRPVPRWCSGASRWAGSPPPSSAATGPRSNVVIYPTFEVPAGRHGHHSSRSTSSGPTRCRSARRTPATPGRTWPPAAPSPEPRIPTSSGDLFAAATPLLNRRSTPTTSPPVLGELGQASQGEGPSIARSIGQAPSWRRYLNATLNAQEVALDSFARAMQATAPVAGNLNNVSSEVERRAAQRSTPRRRTTRSSSTR